MQWGRQDPKPSSSSALDNNDDNEEKSTSKATSPLVPPTTTTLLSAANAPPSSSPLPLSALLLLTIVSTLTLSRLHRTYLRRYPTISTLPQTLFRSRTRSLFGTVTSVGDGDNFRLYHTPGGRLNGWTWLPPLLLGRWPRRRIPTARGALKDQTLHVRIAGVDAPELPHFGQPGQRGGREALDWLKAYLLGKRVRVWIYRRDQYERVVGSVKVWRWGWRRDLGAEMLKAGWATVYEARTGAEFGGMEDKYRHLEAGARGKGKGMWAWEGKGGAALESPREFKTRMAKEEEEKRNGANGEAEKGQEVSGLKKLWRLLVGSKSEGHSEEVKKGKS